MIEGVDQIRHMLGPETQTGLSNAAIKSALYEYYFDIDRAVQWLIGSWLSH